MKIGVSYNLFDGEELLEGSIKQIRNHVDFISVVYQKKSNFGNNCDENLPKFLNELKEKNIIDFIFEYKPILNLGGHFNEITKRNIGLSLSIQNGCTHHMSMDADEYYISSQFQYLIDETKKNNYDSTYCQMKTYYKSWNFQLDPPEDYYVSLLFKIKNDNQFEMGKECPVLVDPTRRMESGTYRIFNREEIEMHHGSYIRKDLKKKLENSSASQNFKNIISSLVDYYKVWTYPNPVIIAGVNPKPNKVKKVKNLF